MIVGVVVLLGAALRVGSSGEPGERRVASPAHASTESTSAARARSNTRERISNGSRFPRETTGEADRAAASASSGSIRRDPAAARESDTERSLEALEIELYSAPLPPGAGAAVDPGDAIVLQASLDPESSSVAIQGHDPGAPRALWLWRVGAERAVLHSRGESLEDGRLAFARAIRPRDGLVLIATPAGARPGGGAASRALYIAGRPPRAPSGVVRVGASGEWLLHLSPREPSADLVLLDPAGRELARFPAQGPRASGDLEIDLAEFSGAGALKVAHEFSNGSRSAWRSIEAWTLHEALE